MTEQLESALGDFTAKMQLDQAIRLLHTGREVIRAQEKEITALNIRCEEQESALHLIKNEIKFQFKLPFPQRLWTWRSCAAAINIWLMKMEAALALLP